MLEVWSQGACQKISKHQKREKPWAEPMTQSSTIIATLHPIKSNSPEMSTLFPIAWPLCPCTHFRIVSSITLAPLIFHPKCNISHLLKLNFIDHQFAHSTILSKFPSNRSLYKKDKDDLCKVITTKEEFQNRMEAQSIWKKPPQKTPVTLSRSDSNCEEKNSFNVLG